MKLDTEQITIPVGETHLNAFLAQPTQAGIYPGVIIGAEIFGVTAYIRRVAERVAALGYVVLAPDFYHRTAPGVDLPRDPAGRERGLQLAFSLQRQEVLDDVQAALQELARRGCPGVGMIGFSLGGHLAYLAAASLPLRATAVLYGGWLTGTDLPVSRPERTLDLTPGMARQDGFLLLLVGEQDHAVPTPAQQDIRRALEEASVRHDFVVYPDTPHGFFSDDADTFRPAAHDDAWARIQAMLARELPRSTGGEG